MKNSKWRQKQKEKLLLAEIPYEVLEAKVVLWLDKPVGQDMYDRVQATIKKYPKFFPDKFASEE